MDTSNIRSNSMASRQQAEKSKKAVIPEGSAKVAKATMYDKLKDDAVAMKNYVKAESGGLFKKFLRELLQGLLNTFLPGGVGPSRNYSSNGPVMTEYNRAGGYNYSRNGVTRASNTVYAYESLYFEEYIYAKEILNAMLDELSRNAYVTVFDMYEFADQPAANTDMNYGWYNLNGANIVSVPEGYKLDLPRPVPIRR